MEIGSFAVKAFLLDADFDRTSWRGQMNRPPLGDEYRSTQYVTRDT